MTTWTKELPKANGWYWWKETPSEAPVVVAFGTLPPHWFRVGDEVRLWPEGGVGEWWPEKLTPPMPNQHIITVTEDMWEKLSKEAENAHAPTDKALAKWKASDQTPQDIRIYAASIPRVEVKINPNQPNA